MATTSVPRWSAESVVDLEFDTRARHYLIIVTDEHAAAHLARYRSAIPVANTVLDARADDVAAALASARTGWRFLLIGDAAAVARVRALVLAAGAIEDEVTTVVPSGDAFGAAAREVFCAHCHTVTATDVRIAETLVCGGCEVELVVYHHFSQRRHAYLGYRPDAEELR